MPITNFERLIQLAEQVFAYKNDPDQLSVNEKVRKRLLRIHPSTISEFDDENGPIAWLLVIPTTTDLMNKFLENTISERELFEQTPPDTTYEALYLCSALVLEEYRRQGIIKQLALQTIENIRKDYPIKYLFAWPFTKEGDLATDALARIAVLPLLKRSDRKEDKIVTSK